MKFQMSEYIRNLYNQILSKLDDDDENKLLLKLKQNLDKTKPIENEILPCVLDKLFETGQLEPWNYSLLIDACDKLGYVELTKWLRDEEIANIAIRINQPTNDDNNNSVRNDESEKKNGHNNKSRYNIVEINGVRLELKFKPYKFQLSLAKLGCDGFNNIVCVRTGSGKTLVAALICKYWATKLSKGKFHAVFIVPTRHLAAQQMEAFHMAGFDLDDLEEITETTKETRTAGYIRERQVVFLTAMKFYNALSQGSIRISELSLLIFDECHHTTEKHPYNDIMRLYVQEEQESRRMPVIVGLTASLGVGRVKDAAKHLMKLCSNLRCSKISCLTRDDDLDDLRKNIPSSLDDEIVQVDTGPDSLLVFIQDLDKYSTQIQNVIRWISPYEIGTPDYERTLHHNKKTHEEANNRKELIAVRCLIDLNLVYLRAHDLPLESCVEYMQECYDKMKSGGGGEARNDVKLMTSLCLKSLESLIECAKKFVNDMSFENAKIKKLVEVILKCYRENSRGLILLRTRHGVNVMEKYLNKHPSLVNMKIKSVKLLGQNNSEDNISMNETMQKEAIEKFRNGECNLLVATDIAQEGLDVPECNYVIRYEFVSNEIGTVQSRGRARANAGQLYLITQRDGINYRRELENRDRERDMQTALNEFNKLNPQFIAEQIKALFLLPSSSSSLNLARISSSQSFSGGLPTSTSMSSLSSFTIASNNQRERREDAISFHVHCRECGVGLFPASDLRYREPSYYSTNVEFIRRSIRIEETKNPSRVFYCARQDCNTELGREVAMRRSQPLYMIDIKGVKFAKKGKSDYYVHSQWSKILFDVKPL